ncbi:hypothetical protein [Pararhizobium sp. PWRC1-1]|uniref:hypothetical protein n=1 Tax=Pararhizobium sp. PWRC1-1 TaxID=2804566 RepID=UPI003CE70961
MTNFTRNAAGFLQNERPNEYEVRFSVEGEIRVTLIADSLDAAKAKAEAMIESEDFGMELDGVTDSRVDHVMKSRTMFLVTRDGRSMQVSRIDNGDLPREPTDGGF